METPIGSNEAKWQGCNWSSEFHQSHGRGGDRGGPAGQRADPGRGARPAVPAARWRRPAPAVTAALRAGRRDTREASPSEAAEFRAVAEAIRDVFDAVAAGRPDPAARQVNELLDRTGARPRLDRHDGEPWHLHFHGARDSLVTGSGARAAPGPAVVLGGDQQGRLGGCTAPRGA